MAHLCWGKSAQHRGVANARLKEAEGAWTRRGATAVLVPVATAVLVQYSTVGGSQIHVYQACLVPSRVNHTAVPFAPGTPASDTVTHQTPTMATCSTACMPGLACGDEREREK